MVIHSLSLHNNRMPMSDFTADTRFVYQPIPIDNDMHVFFPTMLLSKKLILAPQASGTI